MQAMKMLKRFSLRPSAAVLLVAALAAPALRADPVSPSAAAPEAENSPANLGLSGYWTFDEGSGSDAFDYSGHGNKGIVHGTPAWGEGRFGKALHFNGKDSWVEIPEGDWNKAAPITFTMWYKPEAGGIVIEHQLGGAVAGAYEFDGNRFAMYDGAVTDTGARVTAALNQWNFAAISVTPTEVRAYLNGELASTTPIKNMPHLGGSFAIGARGSVGDQFFKGWIDDVAIYGQALSAEEIRGLYDAYTKGNPPAPHAGLAVVDVSLPKVNYQPTDKAEATIAIKNFSTKEQSGKMVAKFVTLLDDERTMATLPVKIAPLGVTTLKVPVTFEGGQYGCQLRANVSTEIASGASQWADSVNADFSVASNFWTVALGGALATAQAGNETPQQLANRLALLKSTYANWVELAFWAPDDWGAMAPDKDWWYSGQEGYYIRRDSLKSLIDQAHAYGMKAISYGKSTSAGPDGWETARRHPDWFQVSANDRVSGVCAPYDLDNWNNRELRQSGKFKPASTWEWLYPNLGKVAPLDFGIDQIALSAKEFGWDGVRFDGHYTQPNDEFSTWNMRRLKERIWKTNPSFLFGFNYAFSPELYNGVNHEMREAMAGGGMYEQEAINGWAYTNTKRYTSWKFYATNELNVAKQVQAIGGSYHCIYRLTKDARGLYKLIYGLIAGGHPVYGGYAELPGCLNWGRFITRFSSFIWGQQLHPMADVDQQVTVQANAPVFWQPLAQEMVTSAHRKYWVIHLVNPTTTDDIDKTDEAALPKPVDAINLMLKAGQGEQIDRIMLARPECSPYDQSLTPTATGDWQSVTVPRLTNWAMVIVELSGNYDVAPAMPRFSQPADAVQVAQAQKAAMVKGAPAAIDPLHPATSIEAGPGETIYETDTGFWNIGVDAEADPDASGGLAQCRHNGGYMGRTWISALPAGRYHFSFRMKWAGPDAAKLKANLQLVAADSPTTLATHVFTLGDDAATGHTPGQYQYHVVDVDIKNSDMVHCYIGVENMPSAADALYLDLIKIKLVRAYSDIEQAAWAKPLEKPADLPTPNGGAPQTILQVKGMYWNYYGVGKAVKCDSAYEMPTTYADLYKYDAVVMDNVDFGGSFQMRKLYKDYVNDGGRLVLLGGQAMFSNEWNNGYVEDISPVEIVNDAELHCNPPLVLGDAANKPYIGAPSLFWRHDVKLRQGAEAMAYAGSVPIVARRRCGQGQVVTFTGTDEGEGTAKNPAYWESPAWTNLLRRMIWN